MPFNGFSLISFIIWEYKLFLDIDMELYPDKND